jgi:hypothetical protein
MVAQRTTSVLRPVSVQGLQQQRYRYIDKKITNITKTFIQSPGIVMYFVTAIDYFFDATEGFEGLPESDILINEGIYSRHRSIVQFFEQSLEFKGEEHQQITDQSPFYKKLVNQVFNLGTGYGDFDNFFFFFILFFFFFYIV